MVLVFFFNVGIYENAVVKFTYVVSSIGMKAAECGAVALSSTGES